MEILLASMSDTVLGTVIVLSIVVLLYSLAKAIMRYIDNRKK